MAFVGSVEGLIVLRDEFTAKLTRASNQLEATGKKFERVGARMSSVGTKLTASITLPLVALGGAAVKLATDFESSFAGVRKTVDATEEEFSALSSGIRELSREIPANVNGLNAIAESAGQLGIKTENILGFTRVMADLGVATNLTAEEAATSMARIANVTGLPQDQFDRLGSTVVALGNNFATTEREIVEFGTRIAGAGEIAGLTEAQILGIGAAMTSVGVQAEAGGTAVQKVLIAMTRAAAEGGKDLEAFAETAGQTADQFAESFKADAAGAFTAFVEGLGREGDKAFQTLETLGLQDQRLIRSFLSLAGAGDLLSRSIAEGTKAFAENTALAREAEQRYKTFASQLTIAWNRIKDVGITLGQALLPVLRDGLDALEPWVENLRGMAEGFSRLSDPMRTAILSFGVMAAAIGPVVFVAGNLISAWGSIMTLAPKMGSAVTLATGPWGILALAITAATLAATKWIARQNDAHASMLSSIAKTNDYGQAVFELRREIAEATAAQRDMDKAFIETVGRGLAPLKEKLEAARTELERLGKTTGTVTKIINVAGSAMAKRVEIAGKETEAFKEQKRVVAELEAQFREANRVLNESAQAYVALTRDAGKATEALGLSADQVAKLRTRLLELDSMLEEARAGLKLTAIVEVKLPENFEIVKSELDQLEQDIADAAQRSTQYAQESVDEWGMTARETAAVIASMTDDVSDGFDDLRKGFADAIAQMVIGAGSLGDAIKAIFSGQIRQQMATFAQGFAEAFKKVAGDSSTTSERMATAWKDSGSKIQRVAGAITAAFAASSGEIEGLMVGAMTAIAAFAAQDYASGIIATIGVVIGAISNIFGKAKRMAKDLAKELGLTLSEELLRAIDIFASSAGTLESALRFKLGDVIREVGIQGAKDLQKFIGLASQLLTDLAKGAINSAQAVSSLGDSLGEILDSFEDAGGSIAELNQLIATYHLAILQMNAGHLSAANINDLLAATFDRLVSAARSLGTEGVEALGALVAEMQAAGVGAEVFAAALDSAMTEAALLVAERNQFIAQQSRDLVDGIEAMFQHMGLVTKRDVEFASRAVVQAFNSMLAAGVPLSEIAEALGGAWGKVSAAADELGISFSNLLSGPWRDFEGSIGFGAGMLDRFGTGFARIGEILDIMAKGPVQRAMDRIDGLAAAVEALGNMGILTAQDFDFFGDSVDKAFKKLLRQGLTSAEALAALAPELQTINDLAEKYGFAIDKGTQALIDQAKAQGLVADQGLTMEDILITGFDRMIQAINALIVAMGGVPVAFEEWGDKAGEAADEAQSAADRMVAEAIRAAEAWREAGGGGFVLDDSPNAFSPATAQNRVFVPTPPVLPGPAAPAFAPQNPFTPDGGSNRQVIDVLREIVTGVDNLQSEKAMH